MAKKKKKNRGGGMPFNPDIDTGIKRPVTARVAVGDVNDKFSDYPSNGLTPRRLARIFREADEGNVRAQMELFEEMEEKDTHLFSQMQTRKLAVTGLDWEVQPFSEDERDKEIADFVDEQLKGIENFDEVLIDMLDAIGKGISIMELAWTVEDGRNVIEDIEYAVIVPKDCFKTKAKMNDTNETTGGYAGSKMHTETLPVYAEALQTALNNHIISHRELLSTAVSTTGNSNAGAGFTGYASSWAWSDCLLRLMSEIQVYGSTVLSSSFYDTGNANIQFPLFRLAPNLKVAGLGHNGSRMWYYLSAVVSAAAFAYCSNYGRSSVYASAAGDGGVRPYFCIG